jgi:hypothetical protein
LNASELRVHSDQCSPLARGHPLLNWHSLLHHEDVVKVPFTRESHLRAFRLVSGSKSGFHHGESTLTNYQGSEFSVHCPFVNVLMLPCGGLLLSFPERITGVNFWCLVAELLPDLFHGALRPFLTGFS